MSALSTLIDWERPEAERIEAAKAVAAAKDPAAIPSLFAVLEGAEVELARAVLQALRDLDAASTLARSLAAKEPEKRRVAAERLALLQDPRSAAALVEAAKDGDAKVRTTVIRALSLLSGPKVYDALEAALADPSAETRSYAAAGLGRSGDARAVARLEKAFEAEEDETVKDFIERALRRARRPAR